MTHDYFVGSSSQIEARLEDCSLDELDAIDALKAVEYNCGTCRKALGECAVYSSIIGMFDTRMGF